MKLSNSTIRVDAYVARANGRPSDAFPVSARVFRLWSALLTLLSVWRKRNRSRACLAQLNDYQLKDIGLTRVQAHGEASKPFWLA